MRTRLVVLVALTAAFIGIPIAGRTSPPQFPSAPLVETTDILSLADRVAPVAEPMSTPVRRVLPPYRMSLECTKQLRRTNKDGTVSEQRSHFRYEDVIDRQGVVFDAGISAHGEDAAVHIEQRCVFEAGRGGPIVRAGNVPARVSDVEMSIMEGGGGSSRDPATGHAMGVSSIRVRRVILPPFGRIRETFTVGATYGPYSESCGSWSVSGRIGRSNHWNPRRYGQQPEAARPRVKEPAHASDVDRVRLSG